MKFIVKRSGELVLIKTKKLLDKGLSMSGLQSENIGTILTVAEVKELYNELADILTEDYDKVPKVPRQN